MMDKSSEYCLFVCLQQKMMHSKTNYHFKNITFLKE
jgi:hypothetical protein